MIDGKRKGDLKKDGIKETTNSIKKSNNDEREWDLDREQKGEKEI